MVPEYVTVTLQTVRGVLGGDFRLPSGMPLDKLQLLLKQALQDDLNTDAPLMLCKQGYLLAQDKTLADYGIWDGSILTVKEASE